MCKLGWSWGAPWGPAQPLQSPAARGGGLAPHPVVFRAPQQQGSNPLVPSPAQSARCLTQ